VGLRLSPDALEKLLTGAPGHLRHARTLAGRHACIP
jgi:hypothetical protein